MSAPCRVLIAALGGEGGGVLASWIADAAIADGFAAQRTSVPGVAQRTGGTTYYIEIVKAGGRRPVMALAPAPGGVELFIASELLEAARVLHGGFITADRTFVISPLHRVYTIQEKIAMGDGRADADALAQSLKTFAKDHALGDFAALAQKTGAALNAVLLGLAARHMPVAPQAFRDAIARDGRAVEANLRGFDAGLAYAGEPPAAAPAPVAPAEIPHNFAAAVEAMPAVSQTIVREGVRRTIDFQSLAYAQLYLDRLAPFTRRAGPELFTELARHLAVRMTSEDTVRVAQLKLRESRLAQARAEARARPGDIVHVTEYLKPGPEEILSILPAKTARALLAFVERRGWSKGSIALKVQTTRISGFLMLKFLASLKFMRPGSLRAAEENAWIRRWLALIDLALAKDQRAAMEIVETARLVKGYGDTWKNGQANWARIADEIIEPMLAAPAAPAHFADAVMQARIAALADPEGARLASVIASLGALKAA